MAKISGIPGEFDPLDPNKRTLEQLVDDLVRPGFHGNWHEAKRALIARVRRGDFVEYPSIDAVTSQVIADHPRIVIDLGSDQHVRDLARVASIGGNIERPILALRQSFEQRAVDPIARAMVTVMRARRRDDL